MFSSNRRATSGTAPQNALDFLEHQICVEFEFISESVFDEKILLVVNLCSGRRSSMHRKSKASFQSETKGRLDDTNGYGKDSVCSGKPISTDAFN